MSDNFANKISILIISLLNFLYIYFKPILSVFTYVAYLLCMPFTRQERGIAVAQLRKFLDIDHRAANIIAKKNLKEFISFFIDWICLKNIFNNLEITIKETGEIEGKVGSNKKLIVSGLDNLDEILKKKNGVVFLTAHFGLFELPALYLKQKYDLSLNAVARVPNFKILYHLSKILRENAEVETIWKKKQSVKAFLNVLKQKKPLALLVDQDSSYNNSFINFMGIPASSTTTISDIAIKNNVPIISTFCYKVDNNKYHLDIIKLNYNPNSKNADYQVSLHYNQILEKLIQDHPAQWPWWHRRWRRRPLVDYKQTKELLSTKDYIKYLKV